jgi:transcriptional regulator with XRE-family HTH domain
LHSRSVDIGHERARELARRFGEELRIARLAVGLSQTMLARRAGVSQAAVSLAEHGSATCSLDVRCRLAAACGHELGWRIFPVDGISLRDSGQLRLAEAIAAAKHASWQIRMEVPVSVSATDRRAADIVLYRPEEVAHIEIERLAFDGQAQIRAAQLKREALRASVKRPVRLIIALPDTTTNRRRLAPYAESFGQAFPVRSAAVWAAIRRGFPIGGDAIMFVRQRRRP